MPKPRRNYGDRSRGVQLEPAVWKWLNSLPYETRQALLYDKAGNFESARNLRRMFWRAKRAPEPLRSLALTFAADLDDAQAGFRFAGYLPEPPPESIERNQQSKRTGRRPEEKTNMYRVGNWIKAKDTEGNETGKRFLVIAIPPDNCLTFEAVKREAKRENDPDFDVFYHQVPVGAIWMRENTRDGGKFMSGRLTYRGLPYDEINFTVRPSKLPNGPGEVIYSARSSGATGEAEPGPAANTESAITQTAAESPF